MQIKSRDQTTYLCTFVILRKTSFWVFVRHNHSRRSDLPWYHRKRHTFFSSISHSTASLPHAMIKDKWQIANQLHMTNRWQVTNDKWLDVIILNWLLWLMTVDLCVYTKTIQWNFNQVTSHHHEASHHHPPPHLTPTPSPTGTIPTVQANMPGAPWRKDLLDSALPKLQKACWIL